MTVTGLRDFPEGCVVRRPPVDVPLKDPKREEDGEGGRKGEPSIVEPHCPPEPGDNMNKKKKKKTPAAGRVLTGQDMVMEGMPVGKAMDPADPHDAHWLEPGKTGHTSGGPDVHLYHLSLHSC